MKPYDYIRKVQREGGLLYQALEKVGWSYARWRNECKSRNEPLGKWRRKVHHTYTVKRVREVQRRLAKGEFLKEIAPSMGMDSRNLARFCRLNGIQLFTDQQRKKNYARRNYQASGRRKGSTQAQMEHMRERIRAGVPDAVLAKELGRHPESIANQRRRMGIRLRK